MFFPYKTAPELASNRIPPYAEMEGPSGQGGAAAAVWGNMPVKRSRHKRKERILFLVNEVIEYGLHKIFSFEGC